MTSEKMLLARSIYIDMDVIRKCIVQIPAFIYSIFINFYEQFDLSSQIPMLGKIGLTFVRILS